MQSVSQPQSCPSVGWGWGFFVGITSNRKGVSMTVMEQHFALWERVQELEKQLEQSRLRERDARGLAEARLNYMNFLSRKVETLRVRVADLATKGGDKCVV